MSLSLPIRARRTLVAGLVAFIAAVSPVRAQQTGLQPGTNHAPQGERFYLRIPDGWNEVVRTRQQGADVIAYVPKGQSAETWTDMLTVQVFQGMTALPVQTFFERTQSTYRKACTAVRGGDLQSGVSNGYASAFWVLACGQNTSMGYGETAFFRLIQGDRSLYILQRSWRTAAFDSNTAPPVSQAASQAALETLQSFGVCDPGLEDHPCPQMQ